MIESDMTPPNMRILLLALLLSISVCRLKNTGLAEGDQPNLPGAEVKLEEAVVPLVDLIAVAKLVKLGRLYPPRIPGLREYDVTFDITRALRGKGTGVMDMSLYVAGNYLRGSGGVQENVKYIIFSYIEVDGRRIVGKVLPDDEDTEKKVIAAIAAKKAEPKTPAPSPGPPIPGLVPIPIQPGIDSK